MGILCTRGHLGTLFGFLGSVLVIQPIVHSAGVSKGRAEAVAVSVDDRGKVLCDIVTCDI